MSDDSLLTEGQQKRVRELCKTEDLLTITRDIFANPTLDGRSKEGRIIREFLKEEGLEYKTTKYKHGEAAVTRLTEQHKQFIESHFDEITAIQISKTLFGPTRSLLTNELTLCMAMTLPAQLNRYVTK